MTLFHYHISWHNIFIVVLLIVIVALIIFIVRFLKRLEQRSIERLNVEKEKLIIQKQHFNSINELSDRIINIEKMLNKVE